MISGDELKQALKADREATFFRLRGGYPIPLAGATWWAMLGVAGYRIHNPNAWIMLAFYTSGLIFPLALLFARLLHNDFMRDKAAAADAIFPAFISMLLFWPIAFAAFSVSRPLVPLVLAIGMSMHWPVIGWTYNRVAIYATHAVVRAVLCFGLWTWWPTTRFTVMPLAVSAVYLATVVAIVIASSPQKLVATQPAR